MSNSSIFTGSSRYSSDLQQVLSRAVSIASLPLHLLNNQLTTLQSRSSALDSLDGNQSDRSSTRPAHTSSVRALGADRKTPFARPEALCVQTAMRKV